MKHLNFILMLIVPLAVVPTVHSQTWKEHIIHVDRQDNPAVKKDIEEWINSVGKPDDLYNVKAFIAQPGGKQAVYDIHLFCKPGEGKQRVIAESEEWKNNDAFIHDCLEGESVVILGFYHGQRDAVWYVKKRGSE